MRDGLRGGRISVGLKRALPERAMNGDPGSRIVSAVPEFVRSIARI